MQKQKLNKDKILNLNKERIVKRYRRLGVSLAATAFFLLLIPIIIFYFVMDGNPANDTGPILMAISMFAACLTLLCSAYFFFSVLQYKDKKFSYFKKEERLVFIKKYLYFQLLRISLLFIGLGLIISGITVKNTLGVTITYCGLNLFLIGLVTTLYIDTQKQMYKDSKASAFDDIIVSNGIYFNLNLIERTIMSVAIIILCVMTFNLIMGYIIIPLIIIMIVLYTLLYLYNMYVGIRVILKFNNKYYK